MTPLTTPPIPPKALAFLRSQNICCIEDLNQFGVARVFLLLKAAGFGVTESLLWKLAALCNQKLRLPFNEEEKSYWREQVRNQAPVAVFPPLEEMEGLMRSALEQAKLAEAEGEVPVGAVVVHRGRIIAAAYNQCVAHHNISHHAEIQALSAAGKIQGNYRLHECDVYVTLEPCAMCAGALIQARVRRVIYAADEPKTGAAGSVVNLFANTQLNTHTAIQGGILSEESSALLQEFFRNKRRHNSDST